MVKLSLTMFGAMSVALFLSALLPVQGQQPQYNILFIGNSLTFKNALPVQFKYLADAGKKKVKVVSSVLPAATLELHNNIYKTINYLQTQNWTHVIMQEQSFFLSLGDSFARDRVWPYAKRLQLFSKKSQIILYETMGYLDGHYDGDTYEGMQQRIVDGYAGLAKFLKVETAHVGKTFLRARRALGSQKKSVRFLYSDYSHPSVKGTFLAAAAIYAQVFKTKVVGLNPKLRKGVTKAFSRQAMQWAQQEYNEGNANATLG